MEPGAAEESCLSAPLDVGAALHQVREAWTTEAGARTVSAPAARFDLRPGGAYGWSIHPEAAPGRQGGEGVVLPAVRPMAMLSFTWNAPSELPAVRRPRTLTKVRLHALGPRATHRRRRHDGWGRGDEW